ncbi:VLRF1 family aeRF1-type release factor [Haloglycomyces albus]|uniref:VLRF1 family aeRF1-type release factor n=1 Tax=Haloglycomyces albus TaxID=526067 RepID=UPI0004B78EF2|nr:VLRF1 family aeRF1-type release factor [Haloglycomyces albus]
MPMDAQTRRRLVSMYDDLGVLSIYVNADPKQEATQPPWATRVEHGLKRLVESTDNELRKTLVKRLDSLSIDLERLVRPSSPGRGRALFVALSDGETVNVEMQNALTDRIALSNRAHISPMVGAWAEGSPAGVVVVDGKGMRVLDHRFCMSEEIDELEFILDTGEWRKLQGPVKARSFAGGRTTQSSSPQYDLFDYKVAEHLQKFLAATHTTLSHYAERYGWEYIVISGEPELVEATTKHFDKNRIKPKVVPSQLVLGHFTAPQVGDAVAPELAAARQNRDDALIERYMEAPRRRAAGSEQVLEALQEGRVERLLLERDSVWSGQTISPGYVLADGIAIEDEEQAKAVEKARLGEEMIESAVASDAEVAILGGNSKLPEDTTGVAALLRW